MYFCIVIISHCEASGSDLEVEEREDAEPELVNPLNDPNAARFQENLQPRTINGQLPPQVGVLAVGEEVDEMEFARQFFDLETDEGKKGLKQMKAKLKLCEIIEDARSDLCTDLNISHASTPLEIAKAMLACLEGNSIYSCQLRRWFRSSDCIPQLLRSWHTLKTLFALLEKDKSKGKTYWKMVWDLISSEEVRIHMARTFAICRPLSLECAYLARITTKAGPAYAIERYTQEMTRRSLADMVRILDAVESMSTAGVTCVQEDEQLMIIDEDGVIYGDAEKDIHEEVFDHRNAIFEQTVRPLVFLILSACASRTRSTAPTGVWKMAGLVDQCPVRATTAAEKLVASWRAILSIEQNRHQPLIKPVFEQINCLTMHVGFRTSCLRVEAWLMEQRTAAQTHPGSQEPQQVRSDQLPSEELTVGTDHYAQQTSHDIQLYARQHSPQFQNDQQPQVWSSHGFPQLQPQLSAH